MHAGVMFLSNRLLRGFLVSWVKNNGNPNTVARMLPKTTARFYELRLEPAGQDRNDQPQRGMKVRPFSLAAGTAGTASKRDVQRKGEINEHCQQPRRIGCAPAPDV